ncbi:MAG: hypothetical protein J0H31_18215 [Alphaproteobacteria bacterium]|nr:hypothetical protein [Alphaproteobacteria bacterium]
MFDETARASARRELFGIVVGGMVSPGYAPGTVIEMFEIATMDQRQEHVPQREDQSGILTSTRNRGRIGGWVLLKGKSLFNGGSRIARNTARRRLPA